jgi:hypothetical protein
MVYGSVFNGPGFYPPTYGGFGGFGGYPIGYPPNFAPNLYPSTFLPPAPALAGNMSPFRPFTGFFPPTYPTADHHSTESTDLNKSFKDYFSRIGGFFS